MNWQEQKARLTSYLNSLCKSFKVSGEESPESLRKKQLFRLGSGGFVAFLGASYAIGLFDSTAVKPQQPSKKEAGKPTAQSMVNLSTPLSPVKEGDIWVSRIEKLVKGYQEDLEKIKSENIFLEKKINTLMGAFGANPDTQAKVMQEFQALDTAAKKKEAAGKSTVHGQFQVPKVESQPPVEGQPPVEDRSPVAPSQISFPSPQPPTSGPQHFPTVGNMSASSSGGGSPTAAGGGPSTGDRPSTMKGAAYASQKKRKLLHLSNANLSDNSKKSPDIYLPAGTYFKVVTAMGVVVSTGTNSSSDPQPILLRIVDNGNLPGGLKGKVKDAVLIGTCYGSASAERAICRLKTLSWRDKSNRNIEKPIEGWIASEDGVQGIRAKIIDRSSDIAREAFGAGLLSAASNFFKMQATSSVYPMTPFGQTNALSKGDAFKGAVGGGVGSALDRLAEFSIKRAESMSPVAYVASGRVLDAVLMRGVDLSPLGQENLSLVNSTSETPPQNSGENR